MASAAGWARLAEDLKAAGFDVKVNAKPYADERYGRIERGVTRSIAYQVRDEVGKCLGCVDVNDKHGRGGKWYGWTVTAVGADDLIIGRPSYAVTQRATTVACFRAAVATLTRRGA